MAFVDDPGASATFWAEALNASLADDAPLAHVGDLRLFFHEPDDQRNPRGGTVPYFAVTDFESVRAGLVEAGCPPAPGALDASGRPTHRPAA